MKYLTVTFQNYQCQHKQETFNELSPAKGNVGIIAESTGIKLLIASVVVTHNSVIHSFI